MKVDELPRSGVCCLPESWPESYSRFFMHATEQVRPLLNLIRADRPGLPISGPASDHDAQADDLESFARPLLMVAQWLPVAEQCEDEEIRQLVKIARDWIVRGLDMGSDLQSASYWGPSRNFHQHQVEMGLLALILRMNDGYVHALLDAPLQERVCKWLSSGRGVSMHRNNHIFFGILILEYLNWAGHPESGDSQLIDHYFAQLESMYLGEGWFIDGMNETVDYYNAFAFHYYGLWWSKLYGACNSERAEWWKTRAHCFLKSYAHLFSNEGDYPLFGRSMTYRFCAIAPFGIAELLGVNPLSAGATRKLCRLNLEFFLKHSITQEQGCLSVGYVNENPGMAESYSCGASPYWAAKAFSFLSIPPKARFWHDEESKIPSEIGDKVVPLRCSGLVIRNVCGRVEVINTGVAISHCNTRYGPFKWGKQSYTSGLGTLLPEPSKVPLDAALTARPLNGARRFGRHVTTPVELGEDHVIAAYGLGEKQEGFHVGVTTLLFWKGPWMLQVHVGRSYQPCELVQGSNALGSDQVIGTFDVQSQFATMESSDRLISMQLICGYDTCEAVFDGGVREHSHAKHHGLLISKCTLSGSSESFCLATLTALDPEVQTPWEIAGTRAGFLNLKHKDVGDWQIEHTMLPKLG